MIDSNIIHAAWLLKTFVTLLKQEGWEKVTHNGSHENWAHDCVDKILTMQDKDGKAKEYQVKQFLQLRKGYVYE